MVNKNLKLSIDQKNLQEIIKCKESEESIDFAGEVRDDTLYLEETYSGRNFFWALSRCLAGKSTGYAKYENNEIILYGVHNKEDYVISLFNDYIKTLGVTNFDSYI